MNAFNLSMVIELMDSLEAYGTDEAVGAMVIVNNGNGAQ